MPKPLPKTFAPSTALCCNASNALTPTALLAPVTALPTPDNTLSVTPSTYS